MQTHRPGFLILIVLLVSLASVIACSTDPAGSETPTSTTGANQTPTVSPGEIDMERVLAPIDEVDLRIAESFPPQYFLYVKSGLPSGCVKFDTYEVVKSGETVKVSVWNLQPVAGQQIACTAIYGIVEHNIALGSDFEAGKTFTVEVNGKAIAAKIEGVGQARPEISMERVLAPIENMAINAAESFPVQYFLVVTSGLPGGCVEFDHYEVSRQGDVVTVSIWNLQPSEPVPCTKEYRYVQNTIALGSDFESGKTYSVVVNGSKLNLATQGSQGSPIGNQPEIEGSTGEPIQVRLGQAVAFGESGLKLQFLEVTEDSRCPKNVVCVWAGLASILVGLSGAGQFPTLYELQLDPANAGAAKFAYGTYTIEFTVLDPYPEAGEPGTSTPTPEYVATFMVTGP